MSDKIEIHLSKTKMLLLLVGATLFVVIGILFVLNPEQFTSTLFQNRETIRIAGGAAVVFFGLCGLFITKKIFDDRVGLTLDENGITDNTNATSVGLIEWSDIIGIRTVKVASTKFLMLDTNKPEKYTKRAKNRIAKKAMKTNHRMYGSPLTIISSSLKIRYADLERLVSEEYEKRKNVPEQHQ